MNLFVRWIRTTVVCSPCLLSEHFNLVITELCSLLHVLLLQQFKKERFEMIRSKTKQIRIIEAEISVRRERI